eukprot:jgi/Hompol1/5895/HPOL_000331-RA
MLFANVISTILTLVVLPGQVLATLPNSYGEDTNYGDIKALTEHFRNRLKGIGYGSERNAGSHNSDVFYFFSVHDYNSDGFLDGHELRLAFQGYELHWYGEEAANKLDFQDIEKMIDHALDEDDTNNDGRISWAEYLESQAYHKKL